MTFVALALILAAAFFHAFWNFLAKRAGGGPAFVWLFGLLSTTIYAPLAIAAVVWLRPSIGPLQAVFLAGTAVLHLTYFLLLQRGYSRGDLSLVYPLARGTGPVLATAAAIALLSERPSALALGGAVMVAAGVFLLAGGSRAVRAPDARWAVTYGLLTGGVIAVYTIWDKHAVSALLLPPLLVDWCANAGRVVLLTPFALRRWPAVQEAWRRHRREAVGVAILSPLSYILVLTAMVFTPVSYVAPAREVSILVGTVLGSRLLAEGDASRRLAAAAAITLGIVALAVG